MHTDAGRAPIVRVTGLAKRFRVRRTWREMVSAPGRSTWATAVDGVTFDVGEREIFGVLGQNGAGKTTIFKMLTTLILPDSGTAEVMGHDVVGESFAVRRLLAPVIANERSLNWRLSARENVRLFTALQGLRGAAARAEEDRVLNVVGLADAGQKLAGAFSSGMRQRLLLARALIGTPRVLLLDEPTRSLDPISARDFRKFLREVVVEQQGCTVLLATHDADEVWDLCDRVGVLERGRLLAVDRTETLRFRVGGHRYRAWVTANAMTSIVERARAAGFAVMQDRAAQERPQEDAGWTVVDFDVPGDADDAARLLHAIASNGAAVSRFERVAPGLADLIERVISAPGGAERTHA